MLEPRLITMSDPLSDLLRVAQGKVDLGAIDSAGTPGFVGAKVEGTAALAEIGPLLADLQERLFAGAYTEESNRRILVILQGMDTSGKGGVLKHVIGLMHPNAIALTSFKKPTAEELRHDFLWRIDKALPEPGIVGVFDRSHYEDVLVARVHELADGAEIERRYDAINQWEQALVDDGCVIIKCMLHMSEAEQRERLLARLEDPKKQWKFKPNDVDERQLWSQYQSAYEIALERCNTQAVPWHVVPSDRKWYRNWAIARLVLEALESLDLQWPAPDYDVAVQKQRLLGQA